MQVPGLAVVAGDLRVHRVLDEQRIQPLNGFGAIFCRTGDENPPELGAQRPDGVKVGTSYPVTRVHEVGDEGLKPIKRGNTVAAF